MGVLGSLGELRLQGLGALTAEADLSASVARALTALGALSSAVGGGAVDTPSGCPESAIRVLGGACDAGNLLTKIFRADYYEQAQRELAQLTSSPGVTWRVREPYLHAVQLWVTVAYQAAALRKIWAMPSFVTPRGPHQRGITPAGPTYTGLRHVNNFDIFTLDRGLTLVLGELEPKASDGSGARNMLLWDDAERLYPSAGAGPLWYTEVMRRANIGPRPERAGWQRLLERNEAGYIDAVMPGWYTSQSTPCAAADGCWSTTQRPERVKVRTGGQMVQQAQNWARYISTTPLYILLTENAGAYTAYLSPFVSRGEIALTPAQFREKMEALARARTQVAADMATGAASSAAIFSAPAGLLLGVGAGVLQLLSRVLPMAAGWSCPVPMYSRTLSGACSTGIERGAAAALEAGARAASTAVLSRDMTSSKLAPVNAGPAALTPGQKAGAVAGGAIVALALGYVLFR